ncbi:terminase [Candidatus Pacearchaeota archaeon]|nr:terminase [Candidatus Pacearchaeota archaeon]
MKLSSPQKQVAEHPARFKVLVTGRRFGKTTLAIRQLAYFARQPNKLCWYVAPSYRQAKQVVWLQIKKILNELNWVKKANEAELSLQLVNGSRICLRGADNPESLRGVGLDYLVLDETADISEHAWKEVLRPTLSDTGGHVFFTGTPKGLNWFHDLYQEGQKTTDDRWKSWQFTTIDGGWVLAEEIEQARKDLDAKTFRQEYEATFETYSGIIYYGFDMKNNVKHVSLPDDITALHIGIDFNLNPMFATVSYIKDKIVYIFAEIQIWSSNTDELAEEILKRYPGKKIFAYPDPAARQRRTSSARRTDASILQNNGFITRMPNRHMSIRDRINCVNSKLCNAMGLRGVIIDPICKNQINSLIRHTYKEGTNLPTKDEGWDHANDSLGYLISFLFPISNMRTEQHSQTFNFQTGLQGGINGRI